MEHALASRSHRRESRGEGGDRRAHFGTGGPRPFRAATFHWPKATRSGSEIIAGGWSKSPATRSAISHSSSTTTAWRLSATRCSRWAAAGCSKARRSRCSPRSPADCEPARRHPPLLRPRIYALQRPVRRACRAGQCSDRPAACRRANVAGGGSDHLADHCRGGTCHQSLRSCFDLGTIGVVTEGQRQLSFMKKSAEV